MELTHTAYGTWSGGRFMHFGQPISEERFITAIRHAYDQGVRTFVTADVYGNGAADEMLGRALAGVPRHTYAVVGMVGHDFYQGTRTGSQAFPRFTDSQLRRSAADYASYLRMAVEKSLERCGIERFDCVLLHNPDKIGYTSDAVWKGMEKVREAGLTEQLGIAPGPANGFTLDIITNFERFAGLVDWAMIILNPMEPWPGRICLPAAREKGVKIMSRVVDCGGLFHDDVRPGHVFGEKDHRGFRPKGWVESGSVKLEKMRPYAEKHGLTMLQLASVWNLSQEPVKCVIPTFIEENNSTKSIEDKITDLAKIPQVRLASEEVEALATIGDNTGCMDLKGGNPAYTGETVADKWPIDVDLRDVAERWKIQPERDLAYAHG